MGNAIVKNLKKYREEVSIKDIIGILVGAFIMAIGIQAVIVPAHLLTGGISGIAIILHYFINKVDIWIWFVVLNIPIFIAGFKFISRRFALYSILGALALTLFLGITETMNFNIDDILLASILGGVLNGVGTGTYLRSKGSTGGLDIIAAIVKRYWGYNFGEIFTIFNLGVIAVFLIMSNIELALFSAISIVISSKVVDVVESGPNISKSVMIISDYSREIAAEIMEEMHRGCTCLNGLGAYTGENKNILMVTVSRTQLPKLKEIIFHIDPQAFMTINESIEVYGKGFKSSKADF